MQYSENLKELKCLLAALAFQFECLLTFIIYPYLFSVVYTWYLDSIEECIISSTQIEQRTVAELADVNFVQIGKRKASICSKDFVEVDVSSTSIHTFQFKHEENVEL